MPTELCCVLTSARAVGGPPTHRKASPHQPSGSSPFVLRPLPGVREASEAECGSRRYPQRWAPAGPRQPAEQPRRDSGVFGPATGCRAAMLRSRPPEDALTSVLKAFLQHRIKLSSARWPSTSFCPSSPTPGSLSIFIRVYNPWKQWLIFYLYVYFSSI